jgi:hypothetical protein
MAPEPSAAPATWLRLAPLAFAAVFGAGLGAGALAGGALARRPTASAHAAAAAAGPDTSCVDRAAMEANANLVDQLRDYRGRLTQADESARDEAGKLARAEDRSGAPLVPRREEWARMARQGTVRLRTPCRSWAADHRAVIARRGGGRTETTQRGDLADRATLAGLSDAELESLDEVYARVNATLWSRIRSLCEANEAYRELDAAGAADREAPDREPSEQIATCELAIADADDAGGRAALLRVAEVRAAAAPAERVSGADGRVLHALAGAPALLHDEMVRTLGREKTAQALDHGVFCVDEVVYDLREPPPEVEVPVDEG